MPQPVSLSVAAAALPVSSATTRHLSSSVATACPLPISFSSGGRLVAVCRAIFVFIAPPPSPELAPASQSVAQARATAESKTSPRRPIFNACRHLLMCSRLVPIHRRSGRRRLRHLGTRHLAAHRRHPDWRRSGAYFEEPPRRFGTPLPPLGETLSFSLSVLSLYRLERFLF